jgi:branched-chain amino acid transport system ATP-binding protein
MKNILQNSIEKNILTAKNLSKSFGKVKAVADVSLEARRGELLGVLGPNGTGKTSLFNLLTGIYKPDKGEILFNGQDITHMPVSKRASLGLGRTFQIPRPFGDMTVYENLLVAATFAGGLKERKCGVEICDILELTNLWEVRNSFARNLPLLDRKRLELARALAIRPKLLLLDEIAGGLTESESEIVFKIVKSIQHQGITIIWIEHIMGMMRSADRLLVLVQGCTTMCDTPDAVMCSDQVMECYLGVE